MGRGAIVCNSLLLRSLREPLLWIELDSDRREEAPRKFTAIRMQYVIEGDVPRKLVERIIDKSHEKNCSVGAMVTGAGATLDWELDIRA